MDRQETEEIKRHLGVVADGLRSEIRLVAEGLEGLRSEFRHEIGEFRKEVRAEFKEVRALIRFSYTELDERLKTVERDVLLLKTRLDEIEHSQR